MGAKYGIPYQGSKARIAEDLIKVLPSGKRFVDLFGGGGAMTHIACISGRYDEVLYNDTQPNLVKLIKEAIDGKYNYNVFLPKWVTRDEFDKRKDEDAYIKYIWSFSNGGELYLFNRDIEEMKKSIHNYVVFKERDDYMKQTFPNMRLEDDGVHERRMEWRKKTQALYRMRDDIERLQLLQQLQQLERLQQLQQLERFERLDFTCMDYRGYEYREGDVVYCDPPYENTAGYNKETFDSKGFYDWVYSRPYVVYFSSYDGISDKRFTPIWAKTKQNLMSGAAIKALKSKHSTATKT